MTKTLARDFDIHNWPVSSETARHDLETMGETHRVVPIPAYDMDGNLIHPQNYHKMLRRNSGISAADSYTADVVSIRLLQRSSRMGSDHDYHVRSKSMIEIKFLAAD
ncbi:hypothetical protein M405DRAFT_830683 [Rhizopogon salebrosus TDB-379]|nr:hypothetical protein M405DRAFT_830683 [Rhizopogon salebrosus TDB-379]